VYLSIRNALKLRFLFIAKKTELALKINTDFSEAQNFKIGFWELNLIDKQVFSLNKCIFFEIENSTPLIGSFKLVQMISNYLKKTKSG
jgi:hypothetical protein